MRLQPDSLKARLLLILLAGIAAMQVFSFGAVGWWRGYEARYLLNAQLAKEVMWLHARLIALAPGQRTAALPAMQRATFRSLLTASGTPVPGASDGFVSPELYALRRAVANEVGTPLAVEVMYVNHQPALRLPLDAGMAMLVVFEGDLPDTRPSAWAVVAYILLVTLLVAVVSTRAVSLVTGPLERLTKAGRALAQDIANAPPLAETGPGEVRSLASGFNAMQRTVQGQLKERIHILAAVSHDLKTPLTRLQLRLANLPEGAERTRMEADLDVMNSLINEGLEYARSAQVREQRVAIDLGALMESLVEQSVDLGHDCRFEPPPRPVRVQAAPRALTRWAQNLLDNALRYGGSAEVGLRLHDGGVEVCIADRGPGLPEAELERMFEPFVRGEGSRGREYGGTGLGLAIARNIARSLNGRTWLSARPGGGLVAHMWLALDEPENRCYPGAARGDCGIGTPI